MTTADSFPRLRPCLGEPRFRNFLACILAGCLVLGFIGCVPAPPVITTPSTQELTPVKPPRDPLAVEAITFADLDLPIEPGDLFQSWMLTQRVHDLTNRKVRITGYMSQGLFQLRDIKEFVLLRDLECCQFGPGGTADHAIRVVIVAGPGIAFNTRTMTVEGTLAVAPFTGSDGKTWSVFRLDATAVQWEK